MQSKNRSLPGLLDVSVEEHIGKRCLPGDVGIELELEGKLLPREVSMWQIKDEGSLRNGMEFVLREPIPIANLKKSLGQLTESLTDSKPKLSLRTSTHFHVNVSRFTVREVYNFIAAYYLLEPLLVDTQPEKRKGNLFCLRMQDAEMLAYDLHQSVRSGRLLNNFSQDHHKYGALNLGSISRIGSAEFRFFEAILDMKVMEAWTLLLFNIVHRGRRIPPDKLLETYENVSAKDFVRSLVGVDYADMIVGGMTGALINKKLHLNYDTVFELAQLLKGKKFELPEHLWREDYDSNDDEGPKRKVEPLNHDQWYQQAMAQFQSATMPAVNVTENTPNTPQPTFPINPHWAIYDDIGEAEQQPEFDDDPDFGA